MNQKRLLKEFCHLVSIDSPSFGERMMADQLIKYLQELGFTVEEDLAGEQYGGNAGNIYAFLKGNLQGGAILFSTHMDTVVPAENKKAVIREDGRITSDGMTVLGADCMAGTAAILEALRSIREQKRAHRDIEVIFFIAEEKHLQGSKAFDFDKIKARESYILDKSGRVGEAACEAPSLLDFQIEVVGKTAHAGFAPEEGVHAIAIAARAISRLQLGHIGTEMTVNIGSIHGGEATNIVPDSCVVTGEIRSFSHEEIQLQMDRVEQVFQQEARVYGGTCKLVTSEEYRTYTTRKEHPVVQRFCRACESLQIPCKLERTFGGSDQNHLSSHGINGIVLASAMNKVHSCEEYTEIGELERITRIVELLMTDI